LNTFAFVIIIKPPKLTTPMSTKSNIAITALSAISLGLAAYTIYLKQQHTTSNAVPMSLVGNTGQKGFCGVEPGDMIQMIRNYRNEVWTKTSDIPNERYDARFMEVSLEQLEHFLAFAKTSAQQDSLNLTSIRIYYINYGGEKKTESFLQQNKTGNITVDYSGCHSLAFVPVVGHDMTDPERRDYYMVGRRPTHTINAGDFATAPAGGGASTVLAPGCNGASTMANHNELCPPFRGCIDNTLLSIADATQ
jgi:hypothetical protein